jgi:hypothetical protein
VVTSCGQRINLVRGDCPQPPAATLHQSEAFSQPFFVLARHSSRSLPAVAGHLSLFLTAAPAVYSSLFATLFRLISIQPQSPAVSMSLSPVARHSSLLEMFRHDPNSVSRSHRAFSYRSRLGLPSSTTQQLNATPAANLECLDTTPNLLSHTCGSTQQDRPAQNEKQHSTHGRLKR